MDEYPELCLALRGHNVGFWEPLWRDSGTVGRQIGRSGPEVRDFALKYREELLGKLKTAPMTSVEPQFFTTGDKDIDKCFGGGIPTRCLTEICGQSSAGKTGLALQLCLSAQSSNTKSVYITTEDSLYIRRLSQLAGRFPHASLDNVLTSKASAHPMQLVKLVETKLGSLMEKNNVNLVVIDSIALFQDWINDAESVLLIETCRNLRRLAHQYNAAIVVINQVRERSARRFGYDIEDYALYTENQERFLTGWPTKPFVWGLDEGRNRLVPSLGYTWTREIDQRIVIKRTEHGRRIELVFSCHSPTASIDVDLTSEGFVSAAEDPTDSDEFQIPSQSFPKRL